MAVAERESGKNYSLEWWAGTTSHRILKLGQGVQILS